MSRGDPPSLREGGREGGKDHLGRQNRAFPPHAIWRSISHKKTCQGGHKSPMTQRQKTGDGLVENREKIFQSKVKENTGYIM